MSNSTASKQQTESLLQEDDSASAAPGQSESIIIECPPKRCGGREIKDTNNEITETKTTKTARSSNKAELKGMRKITTYFKPIPKSENPIFLPKHCFVDCLHNRTDESAGIMTACDACDIWFHHECITVKSTEKPCKKKVWFCCDCKHLFRHMKHFSQELKNISSIKSDLEKIKNDLNLLTKDKGKKILALHHNVIFQF